MVPIDHDKVGVHVWSGIDVWLEYVDTEQSIQTTENVEKRGAEGDGPSWARRATKGFYEASESTVALIRGDVVDDDAWLVQQRTLSLPHDSQNTYGGAELENYPSSRLHLGSCRC